MTERVLVLTNMGPKASSPYLGLFVRNQAKALSKLRSVDYFDMRWNSDTLLNRLFKYPVFFLQFFSRYILSRHKMDVLHVHFFFPTIFLAIAYKVLRNSKVKLVVTCHGSDIYHYEPFSFMYRWCCGWVDCWIYTSQALKNRAYKPQSRAKSASKSESSRTNKSLVLSAGIAQTYQDTRCLSLGEKDIDLLYVGTLDKNKGMDRLLELLPKLSEYRICLAGAGPYQSQLQQAAKLYPNVTLLGPQESQALKALYQRARCFLSLSRNESFGLVMTEAMACYTPVIATKTDGAFEQLQHRPTWLVSQDTETELQSQLIEKIQQLLSLSDSDYLHLQKLGRAQAELCLVDKVALVIHHEYQSLLDSRK